MRNEVSNTNRRSKRYCLSSSTSNGVGHPTFKSSGRGRQPSVVVRVRLPLTLYRLLRKKVSNISGFVRRLVIDSLESLDVDSSSERIEELRLEVEIDCLCDELERLHRWQKLILKHGSYAKAYLEELKGGIVGDRMPFYLRRPKPEVGDKEKLVVQNVIHYREAISELLADKLNRLMQLKMSKLGTNKRGGR